MKTTKSSSELPAETGLNAAWMFMPLLLPTGLSTWPSSFQPSSKQESRFLSILETRTLSATGEEVKPGPMLFSGLVKLISNKQLTKTGLLMAKLLAS